MKLQLNIMYFEDGIYIHIIDGAHKDVAQVKQEQKAS